MDLPYKTKRMNSSFAPHLPERFNVLASLQVYFGNQPNLGILKAMYYMAFRNENATLNIEANSHPPKDFLSIVDSPRVDLRATKRIS